jgi:hypothetical protein
MRSATAPHCAQVGLFATSAFNGPIATMNNISEGISTKPSASTQGAAPSDVPKPAKYK